MNPEGLTPEISGNQSRRSEEMISLHVNNLFENGQLKNHMDLDRDRAEKSLSALGWSPEDIQHLVSEGNSPEDIAKIILEDSQSSSFDSAAETNKRLARITAGNEQRERTSAGIVLEDDYTIDLDGFHETSIRMSNNEAAIVKVVKDGRSPSGYSLVGKLIVGGGAFLQQGRNEVGRSSAIKTDPEILTVSNLHIAVSVDRGSITISPESTTNKTYLV